MSSYLKAISQDWFALAVATASILLVLLGESRGAIFFAAAVLTSYRFWQRDHPKHDVKALEKALSTLFAQGERILKRCEEETALVPQHEASQWETKVESFLRENFEESHVRLFRTWSGLQIPQKPIVSAPHRNLWTIVHARLMRLEQFLEEVQQL